MSSKNEGAKIVHELATKIGKLMDKSKEPAAPRSTDPKAVMDEVLTKIEELLDASDLSPEEICQVLDCLKVRYASGPE